MELMILGNNETTFFPMITQVLSDKSNVRKIHDHLFILLMNQSDLPSFLTTRVWPAEMSCSIMHMGRHFLEKSIWVYYDYFFNYLNPLHFTPNVISDWNSLVAGQACFHFFVDLSHHDSVFLSRLVHQI